ncbi:predicted protein [Nematostella vectensis]|uniref:RING-type E3 ubiquitin transferase n=1 Tax=Nematostella vectensis TaxID=45351 RepID=A7SA58_NEMVE|nr:mitochondrial ubiquitin ligase activator of NFKB 1 [Nematostella vectensis]EDO39401.1 predicted protein [Nematostella vectensis]|eukprot:XP_001631464.1 predicted protein [Nematostella vectensis]
MTELYCIVGGIGSAALSVICYAVYRNRSSVLHAVEGAANIDISSALTALQAREDKCIPYAVITGEAHPLKWDDLIESSYKQGVKGLIQEVKILEHKSEYSKSSRTWFNSQRLLSMATDAIPFILRGPYYGFVKVTEPLKARNLDLKVIYDKFEPADSTLGKTLMDWVSGDKTKGFQAVERMLCPGTTLTGIGELSLSEGGVQISPPSNSLPYYLTQLSVEAIIKQLKSSRKTWMVLSAIFACGGSILLLVVLYKAWSRRRERARREREVEPWNFREAARVEVNIPDMDENQGTQCVICLENQRNVVLLNCGHVCSCRTCAQQIHQCPVCRGDIVRMVPIYQS